MNKSASWDFGIYKEYKYKKRKQTVNAQAWAGDDFGETVESWVSLVEKSSVSSWVTEPCPSY